MIRYRHYLKPYAHEPRRNKTDAEHKLWYWLRKKRLGVRFNRKKPLGRFITDFYSSEANLVIEVDGGQRFDRRRAKDKCRDLWLKRHGILVLRFNNLDVTRNTQAVAEEIYRVVRERTGNRY